MARNAELILKALVMNPVTVSQVDFYNPGYLVVRNESIAELTDDDPRPRYPKAEFHDLSGFSILPAFVDTHVHLPQFAMMGIGSESLLKWLDDCGRKPASNTWY